MPELTPEEKAAKAAEKERRRLEFEAKRAAEGGQPKKKQLTKAEVPDRPQSLSECHRRLIQL